MTERDARAAIARLADEVLPALIERLSASSLGELEVRDAGWRVRIRRTAQDRDPGAKHAVASGDVTDAARRRTRARTAGGDERGSGGARPAFGEAGQQGTPSGNGGYVPVLAVGPGAAGPDASPAAAVAAAVAAVSPAVGYYIPRDGISPGRPVELREVLGHIDVLGVRQEVVAPGTGVVARVLAQPGEAVEYGQELLQIEPGRRAADASRS